MCLLCGRNWVFMFTITDNVSSFRALITVGHVENWVCLNQSTSNYKSYSLQSYLRGVRYFHDIIQAAPVDSNLA
jgi:hypothetical protein